MQNGAHLQDEQFEVAQTYMLSMCFCCCRSCISLVSAGRSSLLETTGAKAGFANGGALVSKVLVAQRCLLFFLCCCWLNSVEVRIAAVACVKVRRPKYVHQTASIDSISLQAVQHCSHDSASPALAVILPRA